MGRARELAELATAYDAGGALMFRNRLINGDMRIDQRNVGSSITPTASAYTLDRWVAPISVASKFSVQRNAGSVTPPAGFTNYLGITSASAYSVASGDYFAMQQAIEGFNTADLGWGAAGAQSVTLSFWVRSSLTGTFGGAIRNGAANRSYPFSYTISSANTWEQKSITIPGDTSGTWATDNTASVIVGFSLGMGSTLSSTAGAWSAGNFLSATGATSVVGTNGATWYVTGVQLEAGTVATPFERRPMGVELAQCQRYYEKGTVPLLYLPTSPASYLTALMAPIPFKATKRSTSYVMTYSGLAIYVSGTPTSYTGSSSTVNQADDGCSIYLSTGVSGNNGTAGGYWACSAEL